MKKTDGLIYIYESLITGKVVNRQETAKRLMVDPKTVSRYISDLKDYFSNEDKFEDIEYSRKKGGYILGTKHEKNLNKKDILAISKVLLESRGFSKKEIDKLIEKLLANCVYKDKSYVEDALGNELINYVEPNHRQNLVDKLWHLNDAIKKQVLVEIEYFKVGKNGKLEDNPTKRILEPRGILFSEYYFYLIAFIKGKGHEYPAIYRLDRIKKYRVLEEGFKFDYKDRFQGGEFRNQIQFMQSGKLQTIKFKFKGVSIEAVLDRLPTAEVLSESKGEYVIKAKVFGRGIKMWLLSQGHAIEVLEPKEFRDEIKDILEKMIKSYG